MSSATAGRRAPRVYAQLLLGIVVFFGMDAAMFRGGRYLPWIAPTSGLGNTIRAIDTVRDTPSGRPLVLVVGDSRVGEGFSETLATAVAAETGSPLVFVNTGVPGTRPRVWYYLLREIIALGRPLAAVAIMTKSYHDDDPVDQAEQRADIVFVHPFLSLSDLAEFAGSYRELPNQIEAAESVMLKGLFFKHDLWDLLRDPDARIRTVSAWRQDGVGWVRRYPGRDASLTGLRFDRATASDLPPALAEYAASLRQNGGRPPDNPRAADYQRAWLGRIADLCRRHGVRLFLFRVPRGPLHHLADAQTPPDGAIAELARGGKLELLAADLFESLERPEFFFDEAHLNRSGRAAFSPILARAILGRLTPPP